MSKKETYEAWTEELILPVLEEFSFSLVDVEYVKEGPEYFLRCYIDKPGGITIDDCVTVSRRMNELLDEADFIPDAYNFEVSSPGLGRPLKKDRDYVRNRDKAVEIKTYRAQDGAKEFAGVLCAWDEDTVTLSCDGVLRVFERGNIARIREAVDWNSEG